MPGDLAVGTRDHHYPMSQRAATLWYHDHRMDFTGPAVYRGLLGLHLVRDGVEDALPLSRGDREIPLVLCDPSFDADGGFAYPSLDRSLRRGPGAEAAWMEGVQGRRAGQRRALARRRGRRGPAPAADPQRRESPPLLARLPGPRGARPPAHRDRLRRRPARRAGRAADRRPRAGGAARRRRGPRARFRRDRGHGRRSAGYRTDPRRAAVPGRPRRARRQRRAGRPRPRSSPLSPARCAASSCSAAARSGTTRAARSTTGPSTPTARCRGPGPTSTISPGRRSTVSAAHRRTVRGPTCATPAVVTRCGYPCTVWIPLLRSAYAPRDR